MPRTREIKTRGRYRQLFRRRIVCWVKHYPQLIVLEVALFQEPFFLKLSIEAKAVFIQLLILCYQSPTVEYDAWDLTELFQIHIADFRKAIQELEGIYDPYYHQPLICFLRDENNVSHLHLPLVDRRVRPMVLRARYLYQKSGRFSRRTREEKEERLRRDEAA